jgi:hypothetical protein
VGFLTKSEWKVFFHSSWKTFRSQFESTLRDLKKHRDLLSDEKITVTILEVRELRSSMESKLSELSRQLQHMQLADEDSAVLQRQEELEKKRSFIIGKLDAPNHAYDLDRASAERRGSSTGNWILDNPTFLEWSDTSSPGHCMLHVHGSPGTGKLRECCR